MTNIAAGLHLATASPSGFGELGGRQCIAFPPQWSPATHCLLPDLFEAAIEVVKCPERQQALQIAADLLLPRSELLPKLLLRPQSLAIGFDETSEQESLFPSQQALALAAEAMASLGQGYALVVPNPKLLDSDSLDFLRILAERAPTHGFAVLLASAHPDLPAPPMVVDAPAQPGSTPGLWIQQRGSRGHRLLAGTGIALPAPTARRLGITVPGPGFVLAPGPVSAMARRRLADRLGLQGWNHVRTHGLLLATNSPALVNHHALFAASLQTVGRPFLYHHYVALANFADQADCGPRQAALAALCAARLAPRVAIPGGFSEASRLYDMALRSGQLVPVEQADALQQMANMQAVIGGAERWALAEQLYARAVLLLDHAPADRRTAQVRIRILNGRALIAYRLRQLDNAEELEAEALEIAHSHAQHWPDLQVWAQSLILGNLATLMLNGRGSLSEAISFSRQAYAARIATGRDAAPEAARLAALLVRAGQHDEGLALLATQVDVAGEANWTESRLHAVLLSALLLAREGRLSEARTRIIQNRQMINLLGSPLALGIAERIDCAQAIA